MTKQERKEFLLTQDLLEEEAEEVADEFLDSADESDLTIVAVFENREELGKNYLKNVVGELDHHVAAVLDLDALGANLIDTCDEYLRCGWSGRIIQFEL